jgi:hypothetical protein
VKGEEKEEKGEEGREKERKRKGQEKGGHTLQEQVLVVGPVPKQSVKGGEGGEEEKERRREDTRYKNRSSWWDRSPSNP